MAQNFNDKIAAEQTEWLKENYPNVERGMHGKKKYDWILPMDLWTNGLWDGIRKNLPEYLKKEQIQKHKCSNNLKSSWTLCANLYFPFIKDLDLIASFLRENVDSSINKVDKIELEYAEEKHPLSELFGEPHGRRGANQTSPDIGFIVNGGEGLILVEVKYTEKNFSDCSGRRKYNSEPERCFDIKSLIENTEEKCNQCNWKAERRQNRKYWDYLNLSDYGKENLNKCPASRNGYQLFRQQALAEALLEKEEYKFAVSCVAYDSENKTLANCLKSIGLDRLSDFGKLFDGKAKFSTFTHQKWVQWVRDNGSNQWNDWLEYIQKRYGYLN